jgi:hypothetical protein
LPGSEAGGGLPLDRLQVEDLAGDIVVMSMPLTNAQTLRPVICSTASREFALTGVLEEHPNFSHPLMLVPRDHVALGAGEAVSSGSKPGCPGRRNASAPLWPAPESSL